jgi:uncharacterized UBP type Zn finger protein
MNISSNDNNGNNPNDFDGGQDLWVCLVCGFIGMHLYVFIYVYV